MGDATKLLAPAAFGVLLLVVAGGFLYVSEQQVTADAQEVDATVLSSEVVNGEPDAREPDARDTDNYRPSVECRYSVDGETYTSSSPCPGAGSACAPTGEDRSDVEAFVERYPEGETVTAYVQAGYPSSAFLESDGAAHWYLVLSGIGVVAALSSARKWLRES